MNDPQPMAPDQSMPMTQEVAPAGSVCRTCLHALRGRPVNGGCSECNTPVLRGLDREWIGSVRLDSLEKLRRLARFALLASALPLLLQSFVFIMEATGLQIAPRGISDVFFYIAAATHLLVMIRSVLASMLFFSANAVTALRSRTLVIAACCEIVAAFVPVVIVGLYYSGLMNQTAMFGCSALGMLVGPSGTIFVGLCFRTLSYQLSNVPLRWFALIHVLAGSFSLLFGVPYALFFLSIITGSGSASPLGWFTMLPWWAADVSRYIAFVPILTLPLMLAIFSFTLNRLVAARRQAL